MNFLILRTYNASNKNISKYNLICKKRYIFFDYKNNIVNSAGIDEENTNIKDILLINKHKFINATKKTRFYIIKQCLKKYKIQFENFEKRDEIEKYINLIYDFFKDSLTNSILFSELKRKFKIIKIEEI